MCIVVQKSNIERSPASVSPAQLLEDRAPDGRHLLHVPARQAVAQPPLEYPAVQDRLPLGLAAQQIEVGDALLRPADYSRTLLPHFQPPGSSVSRRGPFVWKIGAPLVPTTATATAISSTGTALPPGKPPPRKKQSTGPRPEHLGDGGGEDLQEEVLYLGRKENELYLCERRLTSFRILRLSPSSA